MKTLQKNSKSINLKLSFDIDLIDSMVDDLTRRQFSILSSTACKKSRRQICEDFGINDYIIDTEIDQIVDMFEVADINQAVALYNYWIQDFEAKLKIRRGF
ncbi:MAG: hypothetical protein P1V20_07715 [Verrucomicrobiales bacterium]|nr:hypothetical protein [Verrucomicrobiales bacterium]